MVPRPASRGGCLRDSSPSNAWPSSAALDQLRAALGDRYILDRELGRGGMATVYLARDLHLDRSVAVKILRPELSGAVDADRFVREVQVAARLTHSHILAVHDAGDVAGLHYYVMPYVEGESLRARLDREKQLPLDDALRIAGDIACALDYAHTRNIIHRDIKPENILLQDGQAMIADFGIARAIVEAADDRLTTSGVTLGTVTYMSPEQAAGDREIDGRSDIYSLGVVLYEMLAGIAPFTGPTGRSIIAQHLADRPPPLRRFRPGVPDTVEQALLRCLEKIPADRYRTAAEMAAALETGSPGGATPAARTTPPAWRRLIPLVIVVATLAAIALLLWSPGRTSIRAFLTGGAPGLDSTRYVVLPFEHVQSAAPALLDGDACEELLYEALSRWSGITLVNQLQVNDLRARRGNRHLSFRDRFDIARALGAGRVAFGEVWQRGNEVFVRASLFDVSDPSRMPVREHMVRLASLSDAGPVFAELGDSLLAMGGATPGAAQTKDLEAFQAYQRAHKALAAWDLPRARQEFARAVQRDTTYAYASFWLAQVQSWSGNAPDELRAAAARAVALRDHLAPRDRELAQALQAVSEGNFPDACARYDRLAARDSADFDAWYGAGECRARDSVVIRDPRSPSGWSFRGSYHHAVIAYLHALRIVPSTIGLALRGLAFAQVPKILIAEPSSPRYGFGFAPSDPGGRQARARSHIRRISFAALPELHGDTVALTPYPSASLSRPGVGTDWSTVTAAVTHNREVLRDLATTWARAFPRSVDAHEALGRALETIGEIADAATEEHSALAQILLAQRLATRPAQRRGLAITEVRLRLKRQEFDRTRVLAESLLATATPIDSEPTTAEELASLAALTGHTYRATQLMRQAAPTIGFTTLDGEWITPARPVAEPGLALLAYASLGAPKDSILITERRAREAIATYVDAAQRAQVAEAVLYRPATLAFAVNGADELHRTTRAHTLLLDMQRALVVGDTTRLRRTLDTLVALRAPFRPGDISVDETHQEALLRLAIGDTAAATALLDRTLNALPTLKLLLLDDLPQAAALVRAMALRAQLADRAHDRTTARRWATAVVTLWQHADPPLRPIVERMYTLTQR